jgi:hypothetical protein
MALQQQTIDRLENRLAVIANPANPPAVADGMAELRKFKDMAELMGWSRSDGGGAPAEPKKTTAEVMSEWMPIIQMGLGIVAPLVNALTTRLAAPVMGAPPQQPMPGTAPVQQQQAPPPDPNSPQARNLRFLQQIENAFLGHLLSPETDGFTFAQWMISGGSGVGESLDGRALYRSVVAEFGIRPDKTCGLDQLIRTYPPIWERAKSDLPSYQKFLTEFFNYDQQMGEQVPSAKKATA